MDDHEMDAEALPDLPDPSAEAAGGAFGAAVGGRARRGRGFREEGGGGGSGAGGGGGWERLESGGGGGPARSMNGWVVICTGLHEESQHDDVYDAFADHGEVRTLHMNTDRQTGYVKGYALVEFDEKAEAQAAIDALDGTELLTKTIAVDWAFTKGPARGGRR